MTIRTAFVGHDAAKHAVLRWHYSRAMPTSKTVRVGVWEDERFIGVVLFGRGAAPHLGKPYGLDATEVCELTRVALDRHTAPVTQIVAAAIRDLRRVCPGLRLIVSFADPAEGHHGGIYQAGGWLYVGDTPPARYFRVRGRVRHPRSIGQLGVVQSLDAIRKALDPNATIVDKPGKHRYVYPLDRAMRRRITPLAKQPPARHTPPVTSDGYTHAGEGSTVTRRPPGSERQVRPLPPAPRTRNAPRATRR